MSEPFRSAEGYHLVKVEERRTAKGAVEIRARQILIKVEPGSDTIDSLSTYIRGVTEAIREDGFEEAASKLGLAIRDVDPFPQGMFVQPLGLVPRIVNFAFNHRPGAVSYPIETASSVYIVKLIEEIPERVRPFEEVRDRLASEARAELADAAAKTLAENVRGEMISAGFEAASKARGLTVRATPPFKRMDEIPGIGGNTAFAAACRLLETNAASPPIKGRDRYYIIRVVERAEPDIARYGEERTALLDEMRNEAASRFMANWYQEIRDGAKVEDFRERQLR